MSFSVHEPTTLGEALAVLRDEGDAAAPLAGGTDLLLRIRRRARKYRSVVNIKFVPGLNELHWDARTGLTIGALTTFRAIETHDSVRAHFPALAEAARVVAGVQLRNLATIGGNLGNASPSADSAPPLVSLNATIEIAGPMPFPLDELVRRTLSARHDRRQVVTDLHARYFGAELGERSLVPGPAAHLGSTTFEDWLARSVSAA